MNPISLAHIFQMGWFNHQEQSMVGDRAGAQGGGGGGGGGPSLPFRIRPLAWKKNGKNI